MPSRPSPAHRLPLLAGALVLGWAIVASAAPAALADARFIVANPAPGGVVAELPASLTIQFSQPLVNGTVITVRGPGGASAVGGDIAWQDENATVPLRSAGAGLYRVSYKTVSASDGEANEGAFQFGVGAPGSVSPSAAVEGGELDIGLPLPLLGGVAVLILVALALGYLLLRGRRAPPAP